MGEWLAASGLTAAQIIYFCVMIGVAYLSARLAEDSLLQHGYPRVCCAGGFHNGGLHSSWNRACFFRGGEMQPHPLWLLLVEDENGKLQDGNLSAGQQGPARGCIMTPSNFRTAPLFS